MITQIYAAIQEKNFCRKKRERNVLNFLARNRRTLAASFLVGEGVFLLVLLTAPPVMAVQVHGPPEGYYAHQLAHSFFAAALVYLLYLLHVRPVGKGKAWSCFKLSLLFFLLWNVWTLTEHWLSNQLPAEAFATSGSLWEHRFVPQLNFANLLYYITRFDHLLCLPGIWFLMQSLKTFCKDIARENIAQEEGHE